jgi:formylglycine-generating enzyme required for sulfatase activity
MFRARARVLPWILCSLATACLSLAAGPDRSGGAVQLTGPQITPDGVFHFFFETLPGQTYPVAASSNLLDWTLLTNLVGSGSQLQIEDHDAPNYPQRFYQVGLPPIPLPTPISNMVFIPPGTFTMGSPDGEAGRSTNEGPQTIVRLSRGFWMGQYEVKQVEFIALMGSNVSFFSFDSRLPLDFVTWIRATNYCYALTQKERAAGHLPPGYGYRLPTEAEWEYACRAGTRTPFGIGDGTSLSSKQANFDGTFPYGGAATGPDVNITTIGGSYAPNAWGLYDMHGNVSEWCQDWYGPYPGGRVTDPKGPSTGSAHVLRGGGFDSVGQACRSAKRDSHVPTYGYTDQGFRIVLAADQ